MISKPFFFIIGMHRSGTYSILGWDWVNWNSLRGSTRQEILNQT